MSLSHPSSVCAPPISTEIAFVVPGEPVGKGRPRSTVIAGYVRVYSPPKTEAYERMVATYAKLAMGSALPLEGPLSASLLFRHSVPRSYSHRRRRAILAGLEPYLGRYDVDNLTKSVLDALNGLIFHDDKQIVRLNVLKRPDANPGVDILVKPYSTWKAQ